MRAGAAKLFFAKPRAFGSFLLISDINGVTPERGAIVAPCRILLLLVELYFIVEVLGIDAYPALRREVSQSQVQ